MKHILLNLLLVTFVALVSLSCKDDYKYNDLFQDRRPAVPVTFAEATSYGGNPYILSSLAANGPITFTLTIPAANGRTIKEITKVVGGATGINPGTLTTAAAYNATPIAGTGTTAVFTTTVAAFKAKYSTVSIVPVALPNFTEIAFLFLVTLDDNSQIVTEQVRVRVVN